MKGRGKEIGVLRRDRGAIFLETAFVMPIFMILLCLCVDIPRILVAKQRLAGAGRMVAEFRARNNGDATVSAGQLRDFFFDDMPNGAIKLTIENVPDRHPFVSGMVDSLNKWMEKYLGGFITGVIKFLGNLITLGNLEPYIVNVFLSDKFYSGQVSADMPTLLPKEFYQDFAGDGVSSNVAVPHATFMSGCDSCTNNGKSFIQDIVAILEKYL